MFALCIASSGSMRIVLSAGLLFGSLFTFSQTKIQGTVRDSKTNESLPYCNIAIKGTTKGALTNSDGVFSISVDIKTDTLLCSYVGYEKQVIPAIKFVQNKVVVLKRKEVLLQEITVHANNDFLYNILDQCRSKITRDKAVHTAKVYYGIETKTNDHPIEFVECYYNGYMKGSAVDRLSFKNGRTGLSELNNRYFLTLNSSKAISDIELTKKNDHSPSIPFQFSKREMKKYFVVELEYSDDQMYKIKFHPRNDNNRRFSGVIFIDKKTFALLKIDLSVKNATKHPFLPLSQKDSLYNVDLSISRGYKQDGDACLPDHINFSYHVTYKSVRDSINFRIQSRITRDINTTGVVCFYDYDTPFILPYFEYDSDYDDYRKMSIIPYNEAFWNNNNRLLLSEKQKQDIGFFSHEGQLVNFKEGNYGKNFLNIVRNTSNNDSSVSPIFEYYYAFWSPNERIRINKKLPQNEIYSPDKINQTIQSSLYSLKVQLLLDVTQLDDSLICKSYTVFDANKTFYHLPEQPYTKAFLNIYFDICEIERRKMERELNTHIVSTAKIDSVYTETIARIDRITQRYLKEVQLGKKERELAEWNKYVLKNLNIDNLHLFRLSIE
jgi:CarboxypepD_reg-like domain